MNDFEIMKAFKNKGIKLNNDYFIYTKDMLKSMPAYCIVRYKKNGHVSIGTHQFKVNKNEDYLYNIGSAADTLKHNLAILSPKTFQSHFRRYRNQNLNNKTLLIWRSGGIGDIVWIQSIVKYLKNKYPNAKITFATAPDNISLFNCWPKGLVDEVRPIFMTLNEFNKFDYHLSFEGSIERNLQARYQNCYDVFKEVCGITDELEMPTLVPNEYNLSKHSYMPDNRIIGIQNESTSIIRSVPSILLFKLMQRLIHNGHEVGIINRSSKTNDIDKFIKESFTPIEQQRIHNLAVHSNDLTDCISIVSKLKGVITVDSSISHIAPALKVPTVGIFGPFLGRVRMKYYDNCDYVDTINGNQCSEYPCFRHDNELHKCKYVQNKQIPLCMYNHDVNNIVERLENLMESKNA